MSRTFKKIPPSLSMADKQEWQVDEKGMKTSGQKTEVKTHNRHERYAAKHDAQLGESRDFQQHHSATSRYTRSFGARDN